MNVNITQYYLYWSKKNNLNNLQLKLAHPPL